MCPLASPLCRLLEVHRNLVNEILLCSALLKLTDWELLSGDRPVSPVFLSFFFFIFLPSFFFFIIIIFDFSLRLLTFRLLLYLPYFKSAFLIGFPPCTVFSSKNLTACVWWRERDFWVSDTFALRKEKKKAERNWSCGSFRNGHYTQARASSDTPATSSCSLAFPPYKKTRSRSLL